MGSGFGSESEGKKKKKGTEALKCLMDIIYKYASYIKKCTGGDRHGKFMRETIKQHKRKPKSS